MKGWSVKMVFVLWKLLVCSAFVNVVSAVPEYSVDYGNSRACPRELSGSGSFEMPSPEDCHIYLIKSQEETTIFQISIASNFTSRPAEHSSETADDPKTVVEFSEYSMADDGTHTLVTMATWQLNPERNTSELMYLSRTSHLHIYVKEQRTENKWSLVYNEIKYEGDTGSSDDLIGEVSPWAGLEGRGYRPNHAFLFRVTKSPVLNESSIALTLHHLDVDEGVGEYLLIGAGLNPFEGSPPLFISHGFNQTQRKYIVNEENAYVVFVSRSTREYHKGFRITWEQTGTRITVEKEKLDDSQTEDVLNSVPVCIYNITAAVAEFNKSNPSDWFIEFRMKLADIANDYARRNNLQLHTNISAQKVDLFRVSAVLGAGPIGEGGALYAMLRVKGGPQGGRALFTRTQLQEVVQLYVDCCSQQQRGYRVGTCPAQKRHRKLWQKFLLFSVAPAACLLFLVVWTWKRNPLSAYFERKKEKKSTYYSQGLDLSNENLYVSVPGQTIPKMYLTTEHGRRLTLGEDEIEVFNRSDLRKVGKRGKITPIEGQDSSNGSVRSRNGGVDNQAFDDSEGCRYKLCATHDEPRQQDSENLYDTVKSRTNKGQEPAETRL